MPNKKNINSIVQQVNQLQPKNSGPTAVDTTAAGIVIATAATGAAEVIDSIRVFNPTGGALTTLVYELDTPSSTPTLTDAMKVLSTGSLAAATGIELLSRDYVLPAGRQLRAVCSGSGPVNVKVSSRADELV